MWRHRVLLLCWGLTVAIFGASFFVPSTAGWTLFAQFAAIVLAAVTVYRSDRRGVLRYTLVYRGALALLFAAAGTVVVTAGSTVAIGDDSRSSGFVVQATTNLVVMVLAWRAITQPAPRRAAAAGMIACVVELVAIIADAIISIGAGYEPTLMAVVALYASFAASWAGALVCIAALVSFEPAPMVIVPGARVVDAD